MGRFIVYLMLIQFSAKKEIDYIVKKRGSTPPPVLKSGGIRAPPTPRRRRPLTILKTEAQNSEHQFPLFSSELDVTTKYCFVLSLLGTFLVQKKTLESFVIGLHAFHYYWDSNHTPVLG